MKIPGIEDDVVYKAMVCQRCGEVIFRKYTNTNYLDGGFTQINNFTDKPKDWENHYGIGTLCPVCEKIYKSTLQSFMDYKEVKKDET